MATTTNNNKPQSNYSSKKVKLIARIRDFTPKETFPDSPWISVDDTCHPIIVSLSNQSKRNSYEVDSCYGQYEDNFAIYSREIKTLLPNVYDGQDLTVIGFGARGSGKTYTIHGNEKDQGLAALATNEILSAADENETSIFISLFEVFNERIYDLMDTNHPEVQVLEDAKGKIKLKGLSECILESASEFHKLYSISCNTIRRSHKGLILKYSSKSGKSSFKITGKITFVDLAGYEDARRKSCEGVDIFENSRINKSMYALLNVIHASNANEPRVPFRESKLTRMLQDSFGAKNHVLLLNCLNPLYCQDTVFTLQLASRSCQGVNRMNINSIQKSKYLGNSEVSKGKLNVGSTAKKQSRSCFTVRNKSRMAKESRRLDEEGKDDSPPKQLKSPSISTMQSRFLSEINAEIALKQSRSCFTVRNKSRMAKESRRFDEEGKDDFPPKQLKSPSISTMQSRFLSEINAEIALTLPEEEETFMSKDCVVTTEKDEVNIVSNAIEETNPKVEKVVEYQRTEIQTLENTPNVDEAMTLLGEGYNKEKENDTICVNGEGSPPLSSRLRELSNKFRNLYNPTPIQMQSPPETDSSYGGILTSTKILEPKTPVQQKLDLVIFNSPWEQYHTRSTGLKQSFADEYLKFINSASKEELKGLRGIGEKRASYILELREESPEPFKSLEDLKNIGLSEKQINGMMKKVAGDLFN